MQRMRRHRGEKITATQHNESTTVSEAHTQRSTGRSIPSSTPRVMPAYVATATRIHTNQSAMSSHTAQCAVRPTLGATVEIDCILDRAGGQQVIAADY